MQSRFPVEPEAKRAALLDAVEGVRDTVVANAAEGERLGTLPPATVAALAESGLFTLKLPAVLGGAEADPATQFAVIEALSAIEPSAGWCLMIGGTGVGLPGAFLGGEAIAKMFADGRIPTGAIVSMPTGEAVPVDGGYRVTGRWAFVSGVRHAEWITIGARVVRPDAGNAASGGDGAAAPEFRLMTVPAAAATLHDNWRVAGLKGTGSCDVSLSDVTVPEAFTWDRMQTPKRRGGALYLLGQPGFVANEHAAFAIGVGRGALDAVMALAKSKRRSFVPGPSAIEQRPVLQRMVGLADLKLRAARALVLDVYAGAWERVSAGEPPTVRQQVEMRSATVYATQVAADVVTEAFRYGGGEAAYDGHILQRYLRDINVGAQHLMVSDIAYENHGQLALGLEGVNPLR